MSLPEEFVTRFRQICPDDLIGASLASFEKPKQVTFRINGLIDNPQSILLALAAQGVDAEPIAFLHDRGVLAYRCDSEQRTLLTHAPEAEDGALSVQDLSSMLAPVLLQPGPDERVLDLAAAPGGKTILMADMMNNQGHISAVEPVKGRFFRLQHNLERMGITNTRCYMKDGRAVGRLQPAKFDKVMLDAPCSSESRFRADDNKSTEHWTPRKVSECARKQKRLILSAWDALKPGGELLYCTCSFAPEENEKVVSHLLRKYPGAVVEPITLALGNSSAGITKWQGKTLDESCARACRIWPTDEMDGFFLARIRKPI